MTDATNPEHYKFSNGAETIDITENLTGNGSQAVQYIARATRLDGNNKGDLVEDIEKAIWFCRREIQRITGDYSPQRHLLGVELADLPLEYVWEGDDEDGGTEPVPSPVGPDDHLAKQYEQAWRAGYKWALVMQTPNTSSPSEADDDDVEPVDSDSTKSQVPVGMNPRSAQEPRVWRTIADVPHNVTLQSSSGFEWKHDPSKGWGRPDYEWSTPLSDTWRVSYGPWTEVL